MSATKIRWGDTLDEDDSLPSNSIVGPDKSGVVTKTTYSRNDKGDIVKSIVKTRVSRVEKKIYADAAARKQRLKRFGHAVGEQAGDSVTVRGTEDIPFERVQKTRQTTEEKRAEKEDLKSALQGSDKSAVVGSLRDMLYRRRMERQLAQARGLMSGEGKMPPPEDDGGDGGLPQAGSKPGGYVPPSKRGGASEGDSMRRREENSVRVTNLSEDTREDDLRELFAPFGSISRIYIAYDRETGESRGFAFVNFVSRQDAARAVERLDGYGYDNLILRVEFAAPREQRP
ncbi:hypothetical protein CVIRNUC_001180 [Coccomyxa viridis]|uniref:Eukaryotic translation initiation factor 3 subunit G n=1 Tax=Coccomyxa viridis TaxID=1274662 RepID=A0AAV1HSY8_9CHLO|nr:hypothetical protein CVIRNUC_001180 [Coccomyxa viridis]